MATTVTLSSGVQTVNNAGDTAELIIVFSLSTGSGDSPFTMLSWGIRVADWGKIEWKYDFEDALLVPGTYSVKLHDAQGIDFTYSQSLLYYFFSPVMGSWSKRAKVTLKINGAIEYIGTIQEDSIKYDRGQQSVQFTCDPSTQLLNKQMLFDTDGSTPLNTLGFTASTYISPTTIIEKIYQVINPSISYSGGSLKVTQDWFFYSHFFNTLTPFYEFYLYDITFQEIRQYVNPLFFDPQFGLTTLGDVLRKLALDWCCFTGLIHEQKAFFVKLFKYDATNTQSLGTILNRIHSYRYGLLDYVEVSDVGTGYGGGTSVYSMGTNTHIDGRILQRKPLAYFSLAQYTNLKHAVNRGTGTNPNGTGWIESAGDPSINGGTVGSMEQSGNLIADFWWNFRSDLNNCRVDKIITTGIGYDFLKSFTDDGRKYQAIGMIKNLADSTTEIDAIYLGEA